MWRDRLREASFKGIPFFVEEHETEVGRRLVVNEYPYKDENFTEDMGRAARRYSITAYLIGGDYMGVRDDLMDAIEEGGEGPLVHPYLGTKTVICESARLRESKREGGYATVILTFVPAGRRLYPNPNPVPKDLVSSKADELIEAVKSDFVSEMIVTGVPEWVRDEYSAALEAASGTFEAIRAGGGLSKQTTTELINQAAEWVADVSDLSMPSITLVQDLEGTAENVKSLFSGVFDLSLLPSTASVNLQRFTGFSVPRSSSSTAVAAIANNNALLTESFIRTSALATESKALMQQSFPSYEESIAVRDDILLRIDALAGETKSDTVYEAFRALRAEIANAIPGEDNALPRLSAVQLKQSLPSLVVAYDLYEGVDREQDVIDRNHIRHPAFVPGGRKLSVLEYAENRA